MIISQRLEDEIDRWFLWIPVGIAVGILLFFKLPFDPTLPYVVGVAMGVVIARWYKPLLIVRSLFWIVIGFVCAFIKTQTLNTSMLGHPLNHVLVEGHIKRKENFFHKVRLTVDHVSIKGWVNKNIKPPWCLNLTGPYYMNERVNVGDRIQVEANLKPYSSSLTPGGLNFRQRAYFQGIGGTGYILRIKSIDKAKTHSDIKEFREKITNDIYDHLPLRTRGVAAALLTGEKNLIPTSVKDAFIQSGLAHLLAISGLHFSMLAGIIVLLVGLFFVWFERFHVLKIATFFVLPTIWMYLLISGYAVPAQRACIMLTLMMIALLVDRPAVSLRLVAIAAIIILLITPENILSVSFSLSFAAIIALVSFYESNLWQQLILVSRFKIVHYILGIILTTIVASFATLPLTIDTFHRITVQTIVSNLMAIPLVGFAVMPALLLAMVSMFFGGWQWCFVLLNKSLDGLINIAEMISKWPGSHIFMPVYTNTFIVLTITGGLWLCLWRAPWRKLGLFPICVGFSLLFFQSPPDILVDEKRIALKDKDMLRLSSYDPFYKNIWSSYLDTKHSKAWLDVGIVKKQNGKNIYLLSKDLVHTSIKPKPHDVVISLGNKTFGMPHAISLQDIKEKGVHQVWVNKNGVTIVSARHGRRKWDS